ncbi:MAG: gamma carbonic anhydrase family protein [Oscillospiraceae bacterium]|nr:gamma carbonic anhydrase family protein [Oscillospiraceae bacterium]
MIIKEANGQSPVIANTAKVAQGAALIGGVVLDDDSNVWYGAVLRADHGKIILGKNSNVQDNCVIHSERDVVIGKNVTVGHGVILHGCTVGDGALIGMGATVLDGAVIGEGALVGAGALVTAGTVVPPKSLVLGSPAKVRRELTPEELGANLKNARDYVAAAKEQLGGTGLSFQPPPVCRT